MAQSPAPSKKGVFYPNMKSENLLRVKCYKGIQFDFVVLIKMQRNGVELTLKKIILNYNNMDIYI